ncbi:hypothetical protein HPB50_015768 [Hyalomma asiaticum]|uniref:Uncharacterized protein n=1 Tax=Hyalomma asiaticum TaxID=266040 RepID=A0ACB7T2J2_HYAAI|nr:hypothetical protein HPB50_015768 [Hyalomma asiaticum]
MDSDSVSDSSDCAKVPVQGPLWERTLDVIELISSDEDDVSAPAWCLNKRKPHIVFILADDLGWDDVSFHGSSQIPTPNLDALAADGIILNNYYAQPSCTPSRSALLSGLYAIRTGLQGLAVDVADPWGLPLDVRLMPQHLKDIGYETHLVGKWDVGYYKTNLTPTCRGFDSFYGYYNGEENYYSHSITYENHTGLDFWLNKQPMFSEMDHIPRHCSLKERSTSSATGTSQSHQSPHGAGEPEPFQAPKENVDKFPYIGEKNRTIYAGMVDALDQSVGEVVKALAEARMLDNTVIVFSSDNGGQPWGLHTTRSINWPLRGSKGTVWEGGTRVPAFVWSPLLDNARRVSQQLMHITDWLPTLYSLGGGDVAKLGKLDGFDMWRYLSQGIGSPRVEMLYNIDYRFLNASALRLGRYKLVLDATGFMNERYVRPGGSRPYNDLDKLLVRSTVAKVLRGLYKKDRLKFPKDWRERATLRCGRPDEGKFYPNDAVHLFDIIEDPCELNNVASSHPEVVAFLKTRIAAYQAEAMPVQYKAKDPAGFPEYHNGTWAPSAKTGLFYLFLVVLILPFLRYQKLPPHIVIFLVDELGWDDVSFHGSSQIPTPNIDGLAADGVILNNYYVQPFCTPSRAALMTGLYPIRTGMQGIPISLAEPWGLPLDVRIMPQYFKELRYETHLVGKWHLGCYTRNHTPTSRGFDSFYGFHNGEEDYFTHSVTYQNQTGLDFWHNTEPLWTSRGTYSTTLFTQRAKQVIRNRKKGKPLFLVVSYQAVHGTGSAVALQAPRENVEKFPYIGETDRTIFAGTTDALDQSVGDIFEALNEARMLDNAVVVFSSDNGGAPFGMHSTRSFNWPLRGIKGTLWEGGTRAAAFVWSSLLARRRRVSNMLMHITDWLPTLYSAAGGNMASLAELDGQNVWPHLSNGGRAPRTEMLYNTGPLPFAAAIRDSRYKLVVDSTGSFDQRYQTAGGSRPQRDIDELLLQSKIAKVLSDLHGNEDGYRPPRDWRRRATLTCGERARRNFLSNDSIYLFDIVKDPCELNNLAEVHPSVVARLQKRMNAYQAGAVPPIHKPKDPDALPDKHGGIWAPWVF